MCKSINKRFRGLYWRQLFVTSGMVLLTLMLLGASFFSLSYNYVLGQRSEELRAKAKVVAQLSSTYLENSMRRWNCCSIIPFPGGTPMSPHICCWSGTAR